MSCVPVGKLLGLHPTPVQKLARNGDVPAIRLGRQLSASRG